MGNNDSRKLLDLIVELEMKNLKKNKVGNDKKNEK